MKPNKRLKQIEDWKDDSFFVDNPNGSDVNEEVEWLINRVKKLTSALEIAVERAEAYIHSEFDGTDFVDGLLSELDFPRKVLNEED
jgi:hypothetical protein